MKHGVVLRTSIAEIVELLNREAKYTVAARWWDEEATTVDLDIVAARVGDTVIAGGDYWESLADEALYYFEGGAS